MERRRETELKRRIYKRKVKQNEKPFFKTRKKTKKTWNINQFFKRLNKKGNRENGVFFDEKEKTEKDNFAAVSKKVTHFFGTVFYYIKKHKGNKKTKKRSLK